MKKISSLVLAFLAMSTLSFAQTAKDAAKEQAAITKQTKDALNAKSSKDARQDAKKFVKDGWQVSPGALPIEKQLDKSYQMQFAPTDEDGLPKYIMAEAMSIGENYDAAKMQALELAKQNLAGQIQTEVTNLIDNRVANEQLAAEQAASITKSVSVSKNLISQSIGRVIPVMEVYRVKSDKNKEVLVRIAYNSAMAKEVAKKVVRQDLEKRGDDLSKQLDQLLGF